MDKYVDQPELETQYRSVSKSAITCLVLAVLSLGFLVSTVLVVLPLMGVSFGLMALSGIRRHPDEIMGRTPARIGLALSAILLVAGTSLHVYEYMTEVPEGYERISFRMLKDDKRTALPFSEKALELDGKKVFLKGYVRPGTRRQNLKEFILVGDFGSCCFGGSPKITDVVGISLPGNDRVNYSLRVRKIAGVFRLNQQSAPTSEKDVPRVFYQINADMIK